MTGEKPRYEMPPAPLWIVVAVVWIAFLLMAVGALTILDWVGLIAFKGVC